MRRVELAKSSIVEHQGIAVVIRAAGHRQQPAYEDGVVAAVVDAPQTALKPCERAQDQRRRGVFAGQPRHRVELRRAQGTPPVGEVPSDRLLMGGEH